MMGDQSNLDYQNCKLCPRECGVNREKNECGSCGVTAKLRIARAALHFWEEPCISGERGSGAIFFSGCNLRCVFCQNYVISSCRQGTELKAGALEELFWKLKDEGAHNINLVTPTQYLPHIREAIQKAQNNGFKLPFVYNCGGYEKEEALKSLEGLIDIYLPDCKYADEELARNYSKAGDYPLIAQKAIREMVRQCPSAVFDDTGMMQSGVIVRHLILPGHTRDSKAVLQRLFEEYGNRIYYSIMSQYTPLEQVKEQAPELGRTLTKREYEKVVGFALELGIENGFFQEGEVCKESFIPAFDGSGLEEYITK